MWFSYVLIHFVSISLSIFGSFSLYLLSIFLFHFRHFLIFPDLILTQFYMTLIGIGSILTEKLWNLINGLEVITCWQHFCFEATKRSGDRAVQRSRERRDGCCLPLRSSFLQIVAPNRHATLQNEAGVNEATVFCRNYRPKTPTFPFSNPSFFIE